MTTGKWYSPVQMPYFIRRWIRKHDLRVFYNTNKRIRQLEVERAGLTVPDHYPSSERDYLDNELSRLTHKRTELHFKLTQEV